jgi:hypothetical protein
VTTVTQAYPNAAIREKATLQICGLEMGRFSVEFRGWNLFEI